MKHTFSLMKDGSTRAVAHWMTRLSRGADGAARPKRRWTAPEKVRVLAMLADSGLSGLAFSRKTGVPYSTLCQWRRDERWQRAPAAPGFAEVQIAGPAAGTTASIHLPCGARVEAPVGSDPEWIAAIIKAAVSA